MPASDRPLAGRRVVVTRPRERAAEFVEALERRGAEAIVFPTIRIAAPEDPEPLTRAIARLGVYDWIVFTSANGVLRFWEELEAAGCGPNVLEGVRFACVGPGTGAVLAERGIEADVMPPTYVAEAVVDALVAARLRGGAVGRESPLEGVRILLPLAAGARPVLAEGLAERGATVERVEAYRSVPDAGGAAELQRRLDAGEVDVVTFTSSSTVESFVDAVGTRLGRAVVAAIGPITADTAHGHGLPVEVVAREHTVGGLIEALERHFGAEPGRPGGV